jgi:hypothetical protein
MSHTDNKEEIRNTFEWNGIVTKSDSSDSIIAHDENKLNMNIATPQMQREEEICIICYEKVEEECGNYYTNFCDTCKYAVHIACIEKYISRKIKDEVLILQTRFIPIKCLTCSKQVEIVEITQEEFDNINKYHGSANHNNHNIMITPEQRRQILLYQHVIHVMERQNYHHGRMRNRILCNALFLIVIITITVGVVVSIFLKK